MVPTQERIYFCFLQINADANARQWVTTETGYVHNSFATHSSVSNMPFKPTPQTINNGPVWVSIVDAPEGHKGYAWTDSESGVTYYLSEWFVNLVNTSASNIGDGIIDYVITLTYLFADDDTDYEAWLSDSRLEGFVSTLENDWVTLNTEDTLATRSTFPEMVAPEAPQPPPAPATWWMTDDGRLTNADIPEEIEDGDDGRMVAPFPSASWELQANDVLTLNDQYYHWIIEPIVDEDAGRNDNNIFMPPYPASFWYLTPEDRLKNGLLPIPIDTAELVKPYPASFWWYEESDDRLEEALIPDSIPIGAFINCRNLTYVKIPSTVTSIGREAFYNSGLTLVRIPAGCTYYPTSFPPGCEIQTYSV
jgi:hypothetical protein